MKISVQHTRFNSPLSRIPDLLTCAAEIGRHQKTFRRGILATFSALIAIYVAGCGYAFARPKPPRPNVVVTIQPAAASLFLGQTQAFQATVTGDMDNLNWFVGYRNGRCAGSGSGCGYRRNHRRRFFQQKLQRASPPTQFDGAYDLERLIYTPSRWWTSLFRMTSTSREICVRRM